MTNFHLPHMPVCIQEHKLEVMKGRQTKSALIAAVTCICHKKIIIKLAVYGCITDWWVNNKSDYATLL